MRSRSADKGKCLAAWAERLSVTVDVIPLAAESGNLTSESPLPRTGHDIGEQKLELVIRLFDQIFTTVYTPHILTYSKLFNAFYSEVFRL